jgi:uncharacterized protein YciI
MKKIIVLLFVVQGVLISAQEKKAVYDEALATSLGADEHGMKNYIFVILKTGDATVSDQKERAAIFSGHMKNINRLAEEGKLVLAGPFGNNKDNYRGLFILNVPTVEDAEAVVATDPAVKAGLLKADFYPWYGTAALGQTTKIHEQITKTKF